MLGKLDEELPVPQLGLLTDDAEKILDFARGALQSGIACALVTLVDIWGGAARSLGAHMAVRADGLFCGFVSGGCVEAAVAAEAIQVAKAGSDRTLVLGQGSKFFDIVLPCGGAITLAIHALRRSEPLDAVLASLASRKRAGLRYNAKAQTLEFQEATAATAGVQDSFITSYRPTTRLVLCGRSIELKTTTIVAEAVGYDVIALDGGAAETLRPEHLDEIPPLPSSTMIRIGRWARSRSRWKARRFISGRSAAIELIADAVTSCDGADSPTLRSHVSTHL